MYVVTTFGVFIVDVRTNIVIDGDLIQRAMRITGAKSKRAVVDEALRELVMRHDRRKGMLELEGIGWEGDLDEMRRDRDFD